MIFTAFFRALGQIGDPRFRRVLWLGIGLSFLLLVGAYALFLGLIQWLAPDSLNIPFIGRIEGLQALLSWGSLVLMIGLSAFLMMPVASAFTGLFLEDVARAVEERHYPALPPAAPVPLGDALIDALNFFGVIVGVNVLGIALYPFAGPFVPVVFWGVNGYLLGREYFTLVAMRRIGRPAARALRRRHSATVWAAGTMMAAPLTLPVVNLAIPVLGVATFTHLYHRLQGASVPGNRNP